MPIIIVKTAINLLDYLRKLIKTLKWNDSTKIIIFNSWVI